MPPELQPRLPHNLGCGNGAGTARHMALGSLRCEAHGRRRIILLAALIGVLLLAGPWLVLLSKVGFTYLYWLRPEVHWALPSAVDSGAAAPVPKVIHQTWKSADIPEKWQAARQSCIDLHPDFEHKLWTDEDGSRFIEEHYPWFLPTYLSYPYNIQRVDAIRYFILHREGGIYIDLDMGCLKRLDFLLYHNFTAPMTYPVGISNDIMAARPGDAYLERAIHQLRHWNHFMLIKYVQVMFSTGPMFLTAQYALFRGKVDVAIIPRPTYGKYDTSGDPYLYHLHGSSWHADDAAFVFWLDRHRGAVVALGGLAIGAVLCGVWWRRCCVAQYQQLRGDKDAE